MPMFRARQRILPLQAIVIAIAVASPLIGQRARTTPTPPGWLNRTTNSDQQLNDARFSPADYAITDPNLLFAEGLVLKISGYANPRGFELLPWWSYPVPLVHDRNRLKEYSLDFTVFVPSRRGNPDGNGGFGFVFNPSLVSISEPSYITEENGGKLYVERIRSAPVNGATITYGVFDVENTEGMRLLFTSGDQSPSLPVSRDEYLRAAIFQLEGKNQENLKLAKAVLAKTPYETWMEGAAERKKNREIVLAGIPDKAQAEKTRVEMEKGERATTEALKKDEANIRAMATDARKQASPGDALRAKLEAMTPAERASPAFLTNMFDLVPAGTPSARAVIRENPAFYRARGSPVEPRAILVTLTNLPEPVMGAHRQLYREFDWAALKARLNRRP